MSKSRDPKDLVRISLHIPRKHYNLLKSMKAREDLSLSQIIRRALDLYLLSQRQVLDLEEEEIQEIEMTSSLSESRTKKAILLNQRETLRHMNRNNDSYGEEESANDLFQDLNPEAF